MKYTVIIEKEETGYHAMVPALAGCHSEGDTIEETLNNVKEAIALYLESLADHGENIPLEDELIITTAEVNPNASAA